MPTEPRLVPFEASRHDLPAGTDDLGPADTGETSSVSVILKPSTPPDLGNVLSADVGSHQYLSREELAERHGADPAAVQRVLDFAADAGLTATVDRGSREVELTGTVAALSQAFGVELRNYRNAEGTSYRGHTGLVQVPESLAGDVEAILGLDERPQVRPRFRVAPAAATNVEYSPVTVAGFYGFPTTLTGAGVTVAIAEFGGGFEQSALDTYFTSIGVATTEVTAVSVGKGKNDPGTQDADVEVMLDIEVVHAVAPGAKIVVYFAPNTSKGFVSAIKAAVHDTTNRPDVLSISWGGAEGAGWSAQSVTSLESALASAAQVGLTVTVASGDDGSRDNDDDGQVHVDYPASSAYSLGCGGTRITVSDNAITSEVVWNDGAQGGSGGGGVSELFPVPSWQSGVTVPPNASTGKAGRGVPDVAADASPASGYEVGLNNGTTIAVGGTSAVAPLMAGLMALADQQLGKAVGFANAALYANESAFTDITQGNNDITGTLPGYTAATGWDPCSGLGSPQGAEVIAALTS